MLSDAPAIVSPPTRRSGWCTPVARLALISLLVNLQPSEPFLTPYIEQTRDVSHEDLVSLVYPFWTWSALLFVLPCGLLAGVFGHRRIIYLGLLSRQITRCCLLFSKGAVAMALAQASYGFATAVNTSVFYSYVYAILRRPDLTSSDKINEDLQYRSGTAWVRGAYSLGNLMGSFIGQSLVSFTDIPLKHLFYISWGCSTAGLLFAVAFMPSPSVEMSKNKMRSLSSRSLNLENSLLGTRGGDGIDLDCDFPESRSFESEREFHGTEQNLYSTLNKQGCGYVCDYLMKIYSRSRVVLIWSVWWWLCNGAAHLVSNYYTSMYVEGICDSSIHKNNSSSFHVHQKSFGLLEGLNQGAYAFAVWLPLLHLRYGLRCRTWCEHSSRANTDTCDKLEHSHDVDAVANDFGDNGDGNHCGGADNGNDDRHSGSIPNYDKLYINGAQSDDVTMPLAAIVCISTTAGALLLSSAIWCSQTTLSYTMLIFYTGSFALLLSLAASSIASANASFKRSEFAIRKGAPVLEPSKPSVLFGVNGFMSLLFASVLQAIATWYDLSARNVIFMCGSTFFAVSVVSIILFIFRHTIPVL